MTIFLYVISFNIVYYSKLYFDIKFENENLECKKIVVGRT